MPSLLAGQFDSKSDNVDRSAQEADRAAVAVAAASTVVLYRIYAPRPQMASGLVLMIRLDHPYSIHQKYAHEALEPPLSVLLWRLSRRLIAGRGTSCAVCGLQ